MTFKKELYKIVTLFLVAAYCLHSSSCASTKAAPSGGPRDTIPPVIETIVPGENATDFPLEDGEIKVTFNEYVQIKDANKNILLSPPLKKQVKTRIKGKSVIFTFPEPLDSNRTYSLYCGEAIVDNNEGNPLYGFSYSFSTGSSIDSLMISGTVVDAFTLFPIENAAIALYEEASDSTVITTNPSAIARSDKWGYFVVKNLKAVPYYVFAYTDANTNNRYDQGVEKIAFLNEAVTPSKVMKKGAVELKYYDPKDTSACLSRPSELKLAIFSEKNNKQFITDYKRFSRRGSYIKFNAEDVQIDSFAIRGINNERILKQFNPSNDSLVFWITGEGKIDDTLRLAIKYHKTDSTGTLVPQIENLRLTAPIEKKGKRGSQERDKDKEKRKDLLELTVEADPSMVEQKGIIISFPAPLDIFDTTCISFKMRTPKLLESNVEYTIKKDSLQFNEYVLKPVADIVKGNEYSITFPFATFKDVNGFTNDSTTTTFSLPADENLSSITLEMRNVSTRYIVELVTPQRNRVFREYIIDKDCDLLFPYLRGGDYSVRITEDKNNNGKLDTGDLLKRIQPEKVLLYTLEDGKDIITIKERTDIVQEVDLNKFFGPDNK